MTVETVPMVAEYADILQIGARNMQNYGLLQAVGKVQKPVLLKHERHHQGMAHVRRVHREQRQLQRHALRSAASAPTRRPRASTFDLSTVPFVKNTSHLPVVADPSRHGAA
ncbi:MAG: hypothetical protein R2851_20690 [Caldilineaceae bacterium]